MDYELCESCGKVPGTISVDLEGAATFKICGGCLAQPVAA